jgi:hypothetical protein
VSLSHLWASFLELILAEGTLSGAGFIFLIGDVEPWRHGAVGCRCWMWLDGLAQGGGIV